MRNKEKIEVFVAAQGNVQAWSLLSGRNERVESTITLAKTVSAEMPETASDEDVLEKIKTEIEHQYEDSCFEVSGTRTRIKIRAGLKSLNQTRD